MEKITYLPNGQWALEKWTGSQRKSISDWADSGMREHLDKVPEAKGKLRQAMMSDLDKDMDTSMYSSGKRINPQTNKPEYLLHRSMHKDDNLHNSNLTSWTHSQSFADYWGKYGQDPKSMRVVSAWIPQDAIHSYVPTITRTEGGADFGYGDYKDEGEILVKPHKLNIHNISRPKV